MTSALGVGGEGTGKADQSTNKLREWVSDKKGRGFRKSKNLADVINGSLLVTAVASVGRRRRERDTQSKRVEGRKKEFS